MPQASARSASLHREKMVEEEKKRKAKLEGKGKRNRRTSFPATISSNISVGEEKAKRRRLSLRPVKKEDDSNNNENVQPNDVKQGPTPYIKVRLLSCTRFSRTAYHSATVSHISRMYLFLSTDCPRARWENVSTPNAVGQKEASSSISSPAS